MPAWSLKIGGAAAVEWFTARFLRARALLPGANFDTIIPIDGAETITTQLLDVVGTASADPASNVNGGAIDLSVGDAIMGPSQGRLALTGAGSHVKRLNNYWYAASLAIIMQPLDVTQVADTVAPAVGLWSDEDNLVSLGIFGEGSGGSTTKWVGRSVIGGSNFTTLGPNLDAEESPVWHLFEKWCHPVAGLSFAIDGIPFDDAIDVANVAAVDAQWSLVVNRDTAGDPALMTVEKSCVVVASPGVGTPRV